VLVSMPSRREMTSTDATIDVRAPSSKGLSPRDLPSGCSKHGISFTIVGTEIYNDTSREGNDANCAIVAGLEQQPDRVFT
jgi:hypothetical protein